jgi:molybdenum cofactor cytidylyltransferase
MQYRVKHCAIIILAAGKSNRLGSPKQLLPYRGKSLLQHTVHQAIQTGLPVAVVIGANIEIVKQELKGFDVDVVENKKWNDGISASLSCGLEVSEKLIKHIDGIIFMVGDQPFVSTLLLDDLLKTQRETGLPIIASDYGDTLGTPVLFHKIFFEELMNLHGDTGAKKLIEKYKNLRTTVSFPKGKIDIDTKEDYEALLQE